MRAFSSGLAPLLARSCPRFRPNLPLPLLCSSPRQLSRDITSLSKKLIFLLHRLSTTPRASAVTTAEEHYSEASAKEAEVRGLFGEVGRLLRDGGEGPSETGPAPPAEGVQSGGDTSTAVTSDIDTGAVDVAAVTLDEPKQAAGNYWRYARQVSVLGSLLHFPPSPAQTLNPSLSFCRSGGEQEYIEALSFLHYLLHPPSSTLGHSEALISLAEVQARMADPVSGEPVGLHSPFGYGSRPPGPDD